MKTWLVSEFILDLVLRSRAAKCNTFKKDKSGSVEKVIEKERVFLTLKFKFILPILVVLIKIT